MKILVLNGPNLNLISQRNEEEYGKMSLEAIQQMLTAEFPAHKFTFYQSNSEGELIDRIQTADKKHDGIIINPGGYAHTSVSIRDALEICKLPKIEVHLSHLGRREEFRQYLITASVCNGLISGFKDRSYLAAIYMIEKILQNK
jgi:3-dehydroquinate dehydratase-2